MEILQNFVAFSEYMNFTSEKYFVIRINNFRENWIKDNINLLSWLIVKDIEFCYFMLHCAQVCIWTIQWCRISNLFEHINTKLVLMNWVTYGRNFWKENWKKMVPELRLLRLSETRADWGLTPWTDSSLLFQ